MDMLGHTLLGNGKEKVMVLHGLPCDARSFSPMLEYLDMDAFTYCLADFRGASRSRNLKGSYSIGETCTDVFTLADFLSWPRFHVVGHSFGGMVAQRIVADAYKRVQSIVGICPVPACGLRIDAAARDVLSKAIDGDDNMLRLVIGGFTGGRYSPAASEALLRYIRESMEREAFLGYSGAVYGEEDFASRLNGIPTPALVFAGEFDALIPQDLMRTTLLAWLPNAVLEVIPNCAHVPMQETPVWLANRMESFMGQHAG